MREQVKAIIRAAAAAHEARDRAPIGLTPAPAPGRLSAIRPQPRPA
jgi:hypothetical protein